MNAPRRLTGVALASTALALSLGACSASASTSTPTSNPTSGSTANAVPNAQHLNVAAFADLAARTGTVLLDVRTPEEFATGHLAGARDVDFRAADFDAKIATLDRGTTYAVYCRTGNRSGQALQRMTAAGFTHVADLTGGIVAWTAAGRPVTSA